MKGLFWHRVSTISKPVAHLLERLIPSLCVLSVVSFSAGPASANDVSEVTGYSCLQRFAPRNNGFIFHQDGLTAKQCLESFTPISESFVACELPGFIGARRCLWLVDIGNGFDGHVVEWDYDPGVTWDGFSDPAIPPGQPTPGEKDLGPVADCSKAVGNPCNAATGNKFQREVDFTAAHLTWQRNYNSGTDDRDTPYGSGWSHDYNATLFVVDPSLLNQIILRRGDGRILRYTLSGSDWLADADIDPLLT